MTAPPGEGLRLETRVPGHLALCDLMTRHFITNLKQIRLLQSVRRAQCAQRAGDLRRSAHGGNSVCTAGRAGRNAAVRVQLDVSRNGRNCPNGVSGCLAGFHCPFIDGAVNLTEVVDARVLL